MAITLKDLDYLVTIAGAGSISRAAESLAIAQPALSRRIAALEHHLGAAVFVRGARGISLTPAGQSLASDGAAILKSVADAKRRAQSIACGETGSLKIGFIGSSANLPLMSRAILDFRRERPNVHLDLQRGRSEEIIRSVQKGKIDIGIGYLLVEDDLQSIEIQRERYVLASPRGHRLSQPPVTLADLHDEPLVAYESAIGGRAYEEVMAQLSSRRISPRAVQWGESEETLLELVSVGIGCAIVGASVMIRRDLSHIAVQPISDLELAQSLALFWRPRPSVQVSDFVAGMAPLIGEHRSTLAKRKLGDRLV